MPTKPLRPCRHPGCPALVKAGDLYCPEHLSLHPLPHPKSRTPRPSSASRGYGYKWRQVRKAYLNKHPLCVRCLAQGKFVTATVVDHIIPHRGNPDLLWNEANYQALCKPCHDRKTWTEDRKRGDSD